MTGQRKPTVVQWAMFILMGVIIVQLMDVKQGMSNVIRHVTVRKTSMVSSWQSLGKKHVFTTHLGEYGEDETDSEHAVRHKDGENSMLEVFPVKSN